MLENPQITRTVAQDTAIIPITIPREQMCEAMAPGMQELMAAISAQGIAPTGPWFTHHLRMSPDIFDFEISMPVASPVSPVGRVKPSQWPEMTVARTVYQGPYEGLGEAWSEFMEWIEANGHTPAEDLWESYLVGPQSGDDSSKYRTELSRPLIG